MGYEYTECAIMVFDIGRWERFTIDSPVVWVGGNEPVVYNTWCVEAVFANSEAQCNVCIVLERCRLGVAISSLSPTTCEGMS